MNNNPNINYTLKADLCTGCGLCEGACPSGALSVVVKDGRFVPSIDDTRCNNSKGCSRCFDACPGVGVNITQYAKEYFADEGTKEEKHIGRYLSCFSGHSNDYDIRYHSASGGMVSQFLIWLLENDKIDGAVVTRFDSENPLLVKTFIATNKEEIISARSSKYAPVTFANVAQDIKNAPGSRFVVVGIPCHIQGMRKLMAIDKSLREKVVGLFAIYCSSSRSFGFTEYVMKERGIDICKINYLAYRDCGNQGGLVVKGDCIDYYQDYRKYCHPLKSIFVPRRCLLCIDHYGELADISLGDINIEPFNKDKIGINSLIVRSNEWLKLLKECADSGVISLTKISYEDINRSQPSAKMKKGRNLRFVAINKKLGKKIPNYGVSMPAIGTKTWLQYLMNRTQQFIGSNKFLWPLIKLIKKI